MKDTDKFVIYYYDKVCFLNFLFFFLIYQVKFINCRVQFLPISSYSSRRRRLRRVALSVAQLFSIHIVLYYDCMYYYLAGIKAHQLAFIYLIYHVLIL